MRLTGLNTNPIFQLLLSLSFLLPLLNPVVMTRKIDIIDETGHRGYEYIGFPHDCAIQSPTSQYEWGFVIFRCDYSDQALWERYLAYLRRSALEFIGKRAMNEDGWYDAHDVVGYSFAAGYLKWTIIEDERSLDGASKNAVRDRMLFWRRGQLWKSAANGVDDERKRARWNHAVHVGRDSLDSFVIWEEFMRNREEMKKKGGGEGEMENRTVKRMRLGEPEVVFVLVRSLVTLDPRLDPWLRVQQGDDEEDDEDEDELEWHAEDEFAAPYGSDGFDVGWMYVKVNDWIRLYQEFDDDLNNWDLHYKLPPRELWGPGSDKLFT